MNKHVNTPMRGGGESPLLSIVVPVYNVEKYLGQCLESLINQTLKNIEIIVVNDCSPDNSEAIVLEYMRRDERIVYLKHEENKCLGGARNTGIRAARGEYITFVDSDDYVSKTLYQYAVEYFQQYQVDIVSIPFLTVDEQGHLLKECFSTHRDIYQAEVMNLQRYNYFSAWSKVYRRSIFIKYHLFFPERTYWEDCVFWFELCAAAAPKAIHLPSTLKAYYYYRQQRNSIMSTSKKTFKDYPKIFSIIYNNLVKRSQEKVFFKYFYNLVSAQTRYCWRILSPEYRNEYGKNFLVFLKNIDFDKDKQKCAPLWYYMNKANALWLKLSFFNEYIMILHIKGFLRTVEGYIKYPFRKIKQKIVLHKIKDTEQ